MSSPLACPLAFLAVFLAAAPGHAETSLAEAAGHYAIAPAGSGIAFSIAQMAGAGIHGRFGKFAGTIDIDGRDISRSKVSIVIVPASVSTGTARVDNFLKSNAVFDTANEKQITFRSTSVTRAGQDSAQVTGSLTARGRTSQERFFVTLKDLSRGQVSFAVTGKVLRSRYGMDVGTPIYSNVVNFDMILVARRN